MNGLNICWIWFYAILCELRLLQIASLTAEEDTILTGCLHKLDELLIMLIQGFPKDTDVTVYSNAS